MPIIPIRLGRRSNRSRHGHEGDARLVNCYIETIGDGGKVNEAIYASDGWADFATLSDSGVRASLALDGILYVVAGRSILRVDNAGNSLQIGGIIGDGLVTMARNRATVPQVAVCADGITKIITEQQGDVPAIVQTVTDEHLPPVNSVCHFNGYFVYTIADGRFFVSQLGDGFQVDGLDFATAESDPDGLLRGVARGADLVLFGQRSTEFWQDVGGADFPFARTTAIDLGILAPGSVGEVDQTIAWVASDGTVRILDGYQGRVISSTDVERLIDDEPVKSAITATSWQRRGHIFYAISGTGWTRVYDAREGEWHERQSYGLSRWRAETAVEYNGKWVLGDATGNKLYRLSADAYSESGQPIVMTIQPPPVHGYPYRMVHNRLYVDAIPGVGLNSADSNADPMAMLSYSDDGGRTWSTERMVPIGRQGETSARIVARRLGTADQSGRIYRIKVSADVIKGVQQLSLDAEQVAA